MLLLLCLAPDVSSLDYTTCNSPADASLVYAPRPLIAHAASVANARMCRSIRKLLTGDMPCTTQNKTKEEKILNDMRKLVERTMGGTAGVANVVQGGTEGGGADE